MDIGPQDIVEFIGRGAGPFQRGSLYRVREIVSERPCSCVWDGIRPWAFDHIGLLFCDAPDPKHGIAWCCYEFRPVSRRSDFEQTLEVLRQTAHDLAPAKPRVDA